MTPNENLDCFVSVVTIIRNQGPLVETFVREVQAALAGAFSDYEILLIDRRSDDDTVDRIGLLLRELPGIRFIRLSSNVHPDVAWSAGCENVIGDFVVLMTIDTDPARLIVPAVQQCREGSDVVVGTATQPASTPYRLIRPMGGRVLRRFLDYDLPRNATEFRCLSRRAVNSVTEGRGARHRFPLRVMRTGYPSSSIAYELRGNKGRRKLWGGLYDVARLLVFNSTRPLRYMSGIGILGSVLAFLGALYSLIVHLFKHNVVEGWTTIVLLTSGMFCLMFMILAFFGEYLSRLLDDSVEREYHVVFERNSSVMVHEDRPNVLRESESTSVNAVQTGRDR